MMKSLSMGLALALGVAGCNKVTYVNPTVNPTGPTLEETGHYFIAGLVGKKEIHANAMCPGGVAGVQSKFTVGDTLLHVFTLFLYAPRTYEITCGTGGAR